VLRTVNAMLACITTARWWDSRPAGGSPGGHRAAGVAEFLPGRTGVDGREGSARAGAHGNQEQRAAAQGPGADDILASLERFHDGPLPAELVQLVRCWAKHWGRGVLAAVTLLQVESREVLADLLADPEVGPQLRRLEGAATVAVVQGAGVECVRSALQARGMELADHPL
jgi:hypothetical protein